MIFIYALLVCLVVTPTISLKINQKSNINFVGVSTVNENSTLNSPNVETTPTVLTKYGKVEGFSHLVGNTEMGPVTANIFLGIPYAQPPVDDLRFEKPQPLTSSENEKLNATEFAPGCASFAPIMGEPNFSEDCLYLNVFSPPAKFRTNANGFPVVVFIHGGGFAAGSTKTYGYKEFSANFVSRGIVVVTIQYRLGMFGFMSTGDKNMPGNLALWDQRQALIWINENIHVFGGDKKKITLWGHNSGAACVGALSVSKWTRDLFTQSIEMSGSVLSSWAMSETVVSSTKQIAKFLDCPSKIGQKMKTCLKKKTTEDIAIAGSKLGWRRDDVNFARMQMRFDGDFFDKTFEELLIDSPRKPTMQGINSQESMIFTIPFPASPKDSSLIINPEDLPFFGRSNLVEFINNVIVPDGLYGQSTNNIRNDIISFYADRNRSETDNAKFYITRYTQILSDLQFNIPTLFEVSQKSQENWPVYLYMLNYMSRNMTLPAFGIFQTYEFPHLFGFSVVGPYQFDEDDKKLQEVLVLSLAHFIITGNPSTKFGIWPPLTAEHPLGYYSIAPQPVLMDNLMIDRLAFWTNLSKNYKEFGLVKEINRSTQHPTTKK